MKILGMMFVYGIFFPLVNLLALLLIWHPKVRSRIVFERKNAKEVNSRSFEDVLTKADLCFEFSSEGEYQQVASLIDDALVANKKIELVFFLSLIHI